MRYWSFASASNGSLIDQRIAGWVPSLSCSVISPASHSMFYGLKYLTKREKAYPIEKTRQSVEDLSGLLYFEIEHHRPQACYHPPVQNDKMAVLWISKESEKAQNCFNRVFRAFAFAMKPTHVSWSFGNVGMTLSTIQTEYHRWKLGDIAVPYSRLCAVFPSIPFSAFCGQIAWSPLHYPFCFILKLRSSFPASSQLPFPC